MDKETKINFLILYCDVLITHQVKNWAFLSSSYDEEYRKIIPEIYRCIPEWQSRSVYMNVVQVVVTSIKSILKHIRQSTPLTEKIVTYSIFRKSLKLCNQVQSIYLDSSEWCSIEEFYFSCNQILNHLVHTQTL